MRLKDVQVTRFVQTQRVHTVTDDGLLRLLAALGDNAGAEEQALLARLSAPGTSRAAQLAMVLEGLDADERDDVAALLDESDLVFTMAGRNFLEALVNRAPLEEQTPLVLDQNSVLTGKVGANLTVEALNLSTAVVRGSRVGDAVVMATSDAWGAFTGTVKTRPRSTPLLPGIQEEPPTMPGDVLRVQLRNQTGRVVAWTNVKAVPGAMDPRAAFVDAGRLRMTANADDTVSISHQLKVPVTEPGAKVRFANPTRGVFVDTVADENGRLPNVSVAAMPGENITVAVSDGGGNQDFSYVAATLVVPARAHPALENPPALSAGLRAEKQEGPLFVGPPTPRQVKQGSTLPNCYFPAAAGALAFWDPEALKDLVQDNGDGTYTFTFFPGAGGGYQVRVNTELYVQGGQLAYGKGLGEPGGPTPLWFPLLEKAWARFRGGYGVLGEGDNVGFMVSAFTGRMSYGSFTNEKTSDQIWDDLQNGIKEKRVLTAGTWGKDKASLYYGSGIAPNHAYTVQGSVVENGVRKILLRNPWAHGEAGRDGKDDGEFSLPWDQFMKLFQVLNIS